MVVVVTVVVIVVVVAVVVVIVLFIPIKGVSYSTLISLWFCRNSLHGTDWPLGAVIEQYNKPCSLQQVIENIVIHV